jgi:Protein of unknown function (DUF1207)
MRPCGLAVLAPALLLTLAGAVWAETPSPSDERLAGYALAVIERDLGLRVVSIEVHDGVARVVLEALGDQPAERVAKALTEIEGIERAEVSEADGLSEETGSEVPNPAASAEEEPEEDQEPAAVELFPRVELFGPLIADPREPRFSVAYQRYLDDDELGNVAGTTFGETFALLGGPVGDGRWEFGILGGVFSIFDMDSQSFDLVNSDFLGGLTASARRQWLSGQIRVYHQSSHLGDEFLLRGTTRRVNLSYEGVDLLASADVLPWLRLYLGGGAIFHSEPSLDPFSIQAGVEVQSPDAYLDGVVRPIAAFDYQSLQEQSWHENLSVAGGIQLENPALSRLRLQILGTFFTGSSPNGQFYERRVSYTGISANLYF